MMNSNLARPIQETEKIALFLAMSFFLLVTPLWAGNEVPPSEDAHRIGIDPINFEFQLQEGQSSNSQIKVYNRGSTAKKVKIIPLEVELKMVAPDRVILTERPVREGNSKTESDIKLTFNPPLPPEGGIIELPPRGSMALPFQVFLRPGTDPGEHYKGIGVETIPTEHKERQVIVYKSIMPVIVKPPNGKETGAISRFEVTKTGKKPVNFILSFRNTGDVSYDFFGRVEIIDSSREKVGIVDISPTRIFPGTEKTLNLVWDKIPKGLEGKSLNARAKIFYGLQKPKAAQAQITFNLPRGQGYRFLFLGTGLSMVLLVIATLLWWLNRRKKALSQFTIGVEKEN